MSTTATNTAALLATMRAYWLVYATEDMSVMNAADDALTAATIREQRWAMGDATYFLNADEVVAWIDTAPAEVAAHLYIPLVDHGPFREVHVIRDEYIVTDDGEGGSVDVDHDITTEVFPVRHTVTDMSLFGGEGLEVCTVVREAAGLISSDHYLTFPEGDDTRWATTDTFSDPYGRGELDTTAHLYGFTTAEHRAIVRLVRWLDRHHAATTSDRALLFGGCEH